MTKQDWKLVAILFAVMTGALLYQLQRSPEARREKSAVASSQSQSSISGRSLEEILAYEQTGGPPSDALVSRFRVRLDRITHQCDWTRREASDKLLRMHQILRDEGKQVELLDLTIGLDRASRDVSTDCHELLATLGAMAGK